mgnify:FL=1
MERLIYNNIIRTETDQSIIDNLRRKGWTLIVPPVIPQYDSLTEKLIFDEERKEYSVAALTSEEIQERVDAQALMDAQILASQQIQAIHDQISAGYTVEPENFTLGLSDADRGAFAQMLALTKEALDLEIIINDTPQTISDKGGKKHTISTLRFRQIMVQYGMYYKGLWDQLSN